MASNDVGPAPVLVGTSGDDAIRDDVEVRNSKGSIVEADAKPVAPDQFEEKYETGRFELWAYYSYYIGNNVSLSSWREAGVRRVATTAGQLRRRKKMSLKTRRVGGQRLRCSCYMTRISLNQ